MDLTAGGHVRDSSPRTGPRWALPRWLAAAGYAITGIAAGACYSSFLLARPLGSRLRVADSYVSELEVPGQPASAFFRLTDVAAAVLIVVLAVALGRLLWPEVRATLGCLFLTGVGIAAAADGLHAMPCTPSTNATCREYIDRVSLISQLHQGHTLSSVLGVFCAQMAMLLFGVSPRVRHWHPWLARANLAGGLALVTLGLGEIPLAAGHGTLVGVGLVERLHVLLISTWIAVLGWQLSRLISSDRGRAAGWPRPSRTATSTSSTDRGWRKRRSSRWRRYSGCWSSSIRGANGG